MINKDTYNHAKGERRGRGLHTAASLGGDNIYDITIEGAKLASGMNLTLVAYLLQGSLTSCH
jgi:hypothetical protein